MPLEGFYYTYGDDTDLIERKWLPDLQKRYAEAEWSWYDTTIDDLAMAGIINRYASGDLFSKGRVIVIRNADSKPAVTYDLVEELVRFAVKGNALILLGKSWNKTIKLGKLVKKHFITKEFSKPEIKPFELLDCLNTKNTAKVLFHSNRLFEAGQNPLALFSLVFGHFLLLRQIQPYRGEASEVVARKLKQHSFRIKKAMVANNYWDPVALDEALNQLSRLDTLLRTWRYDEKMLLQMALINLCL